MRRSIRFPLCTAFLLFGLCGWSRAQEAVVRRVDNAKDTAVSLDVIELESGYVFESDLNRNGSFGEQSAVQNSFGYGHRFFLSGHLYLHLGIEYDRFDFSSTSAPVPDHLQSVAVIIGIDYMHNDDVGAFIQIKPAYPARVKTRAEGGAADHTGPDLRPSGRPSVYVRGRERGLSPRTFPGDSTWRFDLGTE